MSKTTISAMTLLQQTSYSSIFRNRCAARGGCRNFFQIQSFFHVLRFRERVSYRHCNLLFESSLPHNVTCLYKKNSGDSSRPPTPPQNFPHQNPQNRFEVLDQFLYLINLKSPLQKKTSHPKKPFSKRERNNHPSTTRRRIDRFGSQPLVMATLNGHTEVT